MDWIEKINIDTTIWKSLILPILVAVLTTLLVEYFAKPWLEARKERLIRNRKQIDEVIFQFQKVSGSMGALLPDKFNNYVKVKHNDTMLENARVGLYGIMEALSRLPHRYVEKHIYHISKTMLFVGYLLSQVESALNEAPSLSNGKPIDNVKSLASELKYFDVYFLANVSSGDGQEKWFRRLFWRKFTQKDSENKVDDVLRRHQLEVKK